MTHGYTFTPRNLGRRSLSSCIPPKPLEKFLVLVMAMVLVSLFADIVLRGVLLTIAWFSLPLVLLIFVLFLALVMVGLRIIVLYMIKNILLGELMSFHINLLKIPY